MSSHDCCLTLTDSAHHGCPGPTALAGSGSKACNGIAYWTREAFRHHAHIPQGPDNALIIPACSNRTCAMALQAPAPVPGVTAAAQNVPAGQPAGAQASGGSNIGAIIGGVVGGVALLVLAALVAACVVLRRRRGVRAEQKLSHYHEYNGTEGVLALEVSIGPPCTCLGEVPQLNRFCPDSGSQHGSGK